MLWSAKPHLATLQNCWFSLSLHCWPTCWGSAPAGPMPPTLPQGMSPMSVYQKWGHMAPAGSLTPTQLAAAHVCIHRVLGALTTTTSMCPDTFSPAQPTEGPCWQLGSQSPLPLQPGRPGAAEDSLSAASYPTCGPQRMPPSPLLPLSFPMLLEWWQRCKVGSREKLRRPGMAGSPDGMKH